MSKSVQLCATVPIEVQDMVKAEAEKTQRTISQTVSLLLASALKEKNRKRGTKESNS
jgi:hypothetical protein